MRKMYSWEKFFFHNPCDEFGLVMLLSSCTYMCARDLSSEADQIFLKISTIEQWQALFDCLTSRSSRIILNLKELKIKFFNEEKFNTVLWYEAKENDFFKTFVTTNMSASTGQQEYWNFWLWLTFSEICIKLLYLNRSIRWWNAVIWVCIK